MHIADGSSQDQEYKSASHLDYNLNSHTHVAESKVKRQAGARKKLKAMGIQVIDQKPFAGQMPYAHFPDVVDR